MKDVKVYKTSILYSALLHVLVLNFLFFSFNFYKKVNYVSQSSVMKASLVELPKPMLPQENTKKEIVLSQEEKLDVKKKLPLVEKPKPSKVIEKPATEVKKLVLEKSIKIENKKTKIEKPVTTKNEIKTEKNKIKKEEKEIEKKSVMMKQQQAQKKMEEKLWAEQLAKEEKQLTLTKEQQAQGVVNKYNALILQAIRSRWILAESYSPDLSAQLLINLKSDGTVLNVELIKSSGNEGFDRSARAAVYKASPLPVPPETDLFNQMKVINLVVRP